jgi:hypothetical protein
MLGDVDRSTRALAVALERRIADRWSVNLESIYLLNIDQADIHYETRRDSFVDLSLVYNF